jgi:hypothetical protein
VGPLGELGDDFTSPWITEVDPAPDRSARAGGTESAILPGTVASLDGLFDVINGDPSTFAVADGHASCDLKSTGIKPMAMGLEFAAVPACQTDRSDLPDRFGDLQLDRFDRRRDFRTLYRLEPRSNHGGRRAAHHGFPSEFRCSSSRATMSSTVKSWPSPIPGQGVFFFVRFQERSFSTTSGQNGQVRHWVGLAS